MALCVVGSRNVEDYGIASQKTWIVNHIRIRTSNIAFSCGFGDS